MECEIDGAGVLYHKGLFIMSKPRSAHGEGLDTIPCFLYWKLKDGKKVAGTLVLPHPEEQSCSRIYFFIIVSHSVSLWISMLENIDPCSIAITCCYLLFAHCMHA